MKRFLKSGSLEEFLIVSKYSRVRVSLSVLPRLALAVSNFAVVRESSIQRARDHGMCLLKPEGVHVKHVSSSGERQASWACLMLLFILLHQQRLSADKPRGWVAFMRYLSVGMSSVECAAVYAECLRARLLYTYW